MKNRRTKFNIFISFITFALSLVIFCSISAAGQQQLPAPGKIEVRSVEPFVYCSLGREGSFSEIESTVGELMQHMQNQNVFPTGAMIGIYYGNVGMSDPDKMRWEIGFPINEQAQVLAPLEKKQWPFSQVAVCVHQGPYDTIGETITKIQEWLEENGYSQAGPILERYLDPDPSRVSSGGPKTEIWIPCVKK
ncbi:MAG: GyrI-like domain-containing protein [Candidatus Saccharicenans sp.]|nr:GyrI-like domain-containing protein [Candidatus Saccharicenans sp.]